MKVARSVRPFHHGITSPDPSTSVGGGGQLEIASPSGEPTEGGELPVAGRLGANGVHAARETELGELQIKIS